MEADTELSALRTDVERLRLLVGPSEHHYAQLRDEARAAVVAAERAECRAGEVRGEFVEVCVELERALQVRAALERTMAGRLYLAALRLRNGAGRARRAVQLHRS